MYFNGWYSDPRFSRFGSATLPATDKQWAGIPFPRPSQRSHAKSKSKSREKFWVVYPNPICFYRKMDLNQMVKNVNPDLMLENKSIFSFFTCFSIKFEIFLQEKLGLLFLYLFFAECRS